MAKLVSQQVQDYLEALRTALRRTPEQSSLIVDEIRSDLFDHAQRLVDEGRDEPAAVAEALAELGPPEELARRITNEVPPWNSLAIRLTRQLFTIGLGLFLAWVAWHSRADTFGFSWIRAVGLATLFLPIVLIIWPGVVWRKNWMFSAIPAGCILVAAFLVISLGLSSQSVQMIDLENPPVPVSNQDAILSLVQYTLLLLFAGLTIYLLLMMQRWRQRWWAIGTALMLVTLIELPYAWEERQFTQRLEQMKGYLATAYKQQGSYPTEPQLGNRPDANAFRYHVAPDGTNYSLFWTRPLSSGYELAYSTKRDAVWIID